ncbi:hypothetical protein WMF30_10455 [Sorangium sp. So ce134]
MNWLIELISRNPSGAWAIITTAASGAVAGTIKLVEVGLRVSKDIRAHRLQKATLALQAAAKRSADSEPPTSEEPTSDTAPATSPRAAAGARRAERAGRNSLPSVPEGVAWRAEVDTRLADLRAEIDARLEHVRTEALREVGEAKADARAAQRHAERAHRLATKLKDIVERWMREIAERLATLEGWMDGWLHRGGGAGPGSRRRGG